ncbi:DinB family protein [Nocardioides sp. J2M5]|uniref:DinB family protein n=1 Tax=Nocardioides palaemonis TaxID=2829810 RepID=UPI001BA83839|nr:DinB family protein [Nocardioides palaemonis]MBS2939242.1 DinB family protein [Nocardioides palaemonis]
MTYTWHDVDGRMAEICDQCGFDAREIRGNADEAARLDAAYAALERSLDHPDAARRPAPETWSAREYVDHCVEVGDVMLGWVADLARGDAPGTTPTGTLTDLAALRAAVREVVPGLTDEQRGRLLVGEYRQDVPVEWLLRHLLHDTEHHVLDVRCGHAAIARADLPEVSFRQR